MTKLSELGYKSSSGMDHICCSYTIQFLTSNSNYVFYSFKIKKNNVIQTLKKENVKCYKQVEQVAFPYSPKEIIDQ